MEFYIFVILFCYFLIGLREIPTKTSNELSPITYTTDKKAINSFTTKYVQLHSEDINQCTDTKLFEINSTTKKCTKKSNVCEGGNLMKFKYHWTCVHCPSGTYSGYSNPHDKTSIPLCVKYTEPTTNNNHNFMIDDQKLISEAFMKSNVNSSAMKNPCKYDMLTGDIVENGQLVVDKNGIVTCIATYSDTVTVLSEKDYLKNNNGTFANGVMRISYKSAQFSIVEFDVITKRPSRIGYAYFWEDIFPWVRDAFLISKPTDSAYVYIFNASTPLNVYNYPINDFEETLYFETATHLSPKPGFNTFYGFHVTMVGGQVYPLVHCRDLGTDRIDAMDDQGLEIKRTLFDHERDELRRTGYAVCVDHHGLKLNPDYTNLSGVIIFTNSSIESGWFGTLQEKEKFIPQIKYSKEKT